ncbi:MAG: toprim domain-containing protein [Solitalea-like symbiont of Acarus siro]
MENLYLTNEQIAALGARIKQKVELINYFCFLERKNLVKRAPKSNFENDESKWIYWQNTARGDSSPSIAMNTRENYFTDFGDANCKGDIFAAAQYFEDMSYPIAVRHIAGLFLSPDDLNVKVETINQVREKVERKDAQAQSNIKITKVYDHIYSFTLRQYLENRGFALDSIDYFSQKGYINEVCWTNTKTGKQGYGVGFKSNGNYVVSFPTKDGNFKFNTGAVKPVLINSRLKPDTINVFEGFFDFLAYKELFPWDDHKHLILNSIVYKEEAIRLIESELAGDKDLSVQLYLDNDSAGQQLTRELIRHFKKNNVDISDAFTKHTLFSILPNFAKLKDVNDYLIHAKKARFSVRSINNDDGGDRNLLVNAMPLVLYPAEAKIFLTDLLNLAKQINYHLKSNLDLNGQTKSYEIILSMNDAFYDKLVDLEARRPTLPKLSKYFLSWAESLYKAIDKKGAIGIDIKNIEQNITNVEKVMLQDDIEKFRTKVLHAFENIGIKDTQSISAKFEDLKKQPKVEHLVELLEHMRGQYRRLRIATPIALEQKVKPKSSLKIKI